MSAMAQRLVIAYGSESGNAQALAHRLAQQPLWRDAATPVIELNALCLSQWRSEDLLVIVSSSFGDGEAPANAEQFYAQLMQAESVQGLRYVLFGLGDTGYPHFCGFTQQLDAALQARGAQALIARVDADTQYLDFFEQWQAALLRVAQGDTDAGAQLLLRVKAYGEDHAFAATVLERECLSSAAPESDGTDCAAFRVRLDVRGSGMAWRAGDTLHVLAKNAPQLLMDIAHWYGLSEPAEILQTKELRLISKTVLRELAGKTGNADLKDLLKFSQRKALDRYLLGADILDVLDDFATPQQVPIEQLAEWLSPRLPRAYSIASPASSDAVELCIRAVRHQRNGRVHHGMATHYLLHAQEPIEVYCRSNPGFHLPADAKAPLIVIGTGTGIAPLIGLLREMQLSAQQRRVCLVFGEKRSAHDFLYRQELLALQEAGVIERLITAFSRDGDAKYYVQHAIAEHAEPLAELLASGAEVYVCGNKAHLDKAVAAAFNQMQGAAQNQHGLVSAVAGDDAAPDLWTDLQAQGRVHLELY